jgi:UDP-N-acetylglucosamine--N-acetylmuramyl-(pentapeptide) pyrophosphoryl-undecaprenol N-acetylglucosamine transferase
MGYPIREDFSPLPRDQSRSALGLPRHGKCLVIFGGSQGAESLSQWASGHGQALANLGYHCIGLTGLGGKCGEFQFRGMDGHSYILRFQEFSNSMHRLYSAADLLICRAGAGTIGELIHCGRPSILVPYPFATGDHQSKNARSMEKQGMAWLLPQDKLSGLLSLLSSIGDGDLETMGERLRLAKESLGNGRVLLVDDVLETVQRRRRGLPPGPGH